jgi:AbrB family looped-hinge helix DNA binding protein
LPDHPIIAIVKVLPRGAVQLPREVREKLDLTPGTKMIVIATEDAVVLRKGAMLFAKEPPAGLLRKIRAMFSKGPIRDIEE